MRTHTVAMIQILSGAAAYTEVRGPMSLEDARGVLDGLAIRFGDRGETITRLSPDVLSVAPSTTVANGCTFVVSPTSHPGVSSPCPNQ